MIDNTLLSRFTAIVGEKNAATDSDDLTRYTHENRGLYVGQTPVVLKPGTTMEVSEILSLAAQAGVEIVPQGGHTGHVGGAVPDESNSQIVVSLERMNRIREIDLEGDAIVCEAGVILETLQKVADDNDRLFPLALGSQGSCQIGGNIATNAGGTGVLAYGNTRQLVLGLEVVLPDGQIWDGLRRLKKDNTGYSLKDLFVGSEGTLGIVTAAVLKLFPRPKGRGVAFCGLASPEDALKLLSIAREFAGNSLTAFELMHRTPLEFTLDHMEGMRNPLAALHPWYVMLEVSSSRSEADASEILESLLETALARKIVADAAIGTSISQQQAIWRIRELMPPAQKHEGASIKHDVSVPVHRIPEFIDKAWAIVVAEMPGARPCVFGHLGDGNIHFNISQPAGGDGEAFLGCQGHINDLIHDLVVSMSGSVAAEHGVGRLKRELVARTKHPVEMDLMHRIKAALDPDGRMNPGKIL